MPETLRFLLTMSASGGILALVLFALKPLMRHRLSRAFQYGIWLIVLLRLILPVSTNTGLMDAVLPAPSSTVPTVTALPTPTPVFTMPETGRYPLTIDGNKEGAFSASSPSTFRPVPSPTPKVTSPTDRAPLSRLLLDNWLWAWLFGAAVFLLLNLTAYVRFVRRIKSAASPATPEDYASLARARDHLQTRRRVALRRSAFISTPMLVGLRRPCIYLPDIGYAERQLHNIFLHELTHLRRFDVAVKWLFTLAAAAHWFNPLVYFVRREVNRACELSCDEAVIRTLDTSGKQSYGETLLSVVAESRYPVGVLSTTLCEEKQTLKERLVSIMKYGRKSKWIAALSLLVLVCFAGCAMALGPGGSNADGGEPEGFVSPLEPGEVPTLALRTEETEIPVMAILKTCWDGAKYDRPSSYQYVMNNSTESDSALSFSRDTVVTLDFGGHDPDTLSVRYELLAYSRPDGSPYDPVTVDCKDNQFVLEWNPWSGLSSVWLSGRVYTITATWGEDECDYVVRLGSVSISATHASDVRVAALLDVIESSPAMSSRPGDYIEAHIEEYAEIVSMGLQALPELTAVLTLPEPDLRCHIAAALCADILKAFETTGQELDADAQRQVEETQKALDAWQGKNLDTAQSLPSFTEEEIAAAHAVMEDYFRALITQDADALWATMTQEKPANASLAKDVEITVLSIEYDPSETSRLCYLQNGRGATNGVAPENVIVFHADFSVSLTGGPDTGAWEEGRYEDENFTLIRENKTAPWRIDDHGY